MEIKKQLHIGHLIVITCNPGSKIIDMLLLTSFVIFVGAARRDVADGVLIGRATRPHFGKYYHPQHLLDCEGANFSESWAVFRVAVDKNARAGWPLDEDLLHQAQEIISKFDDVAVVGVAMFSSVISRKMSVTFLEGFCLYGYVTAWFVSYRHIRDPQFIEHIAEIMGWRQWPLDFAESSNWPTLWRMVPLHLEEYRRRGNTSWSDGLRNWGDDADLYAKPNVSHVKRVLEEWLHQIGVPLPQSLANSCPGQGCITASESATVSRLVAGFQNDRSLRVLALGHHLGASMEPWSMLQRVLKDDFALRVQGRLFGQRHPKPGLACKEFGYCEPNEIFLRWSLRYESYWLGEYEWMPNRWNDAVEDLSEVVSASNWMQDSDALICSGPGWFCAMLRFLWSVPMLVYFAWPICPLVPAKFKMHILSYIRMLGQATDPPVTFVAANWILAAQFALQVRLHVPVQRPHGIYLNVTYAPVSSPKGLARVMITRCGQWAGEAGLALFETVWAFIVQERREGKPFNFEPVFLSILVRGADTSGALKYEDFAKFHACIFWPWDVMMMLFTELYTLGMPLLLPEKRWMVELMSHSLNYHHMNWWHLRPGVAGRLPDPSAVPFPLPHVPWIEGSSGRDAMAYWYELTDFQQFPHIIYFGSIPDMLRRANTIDVPSVREAMAKFNKETLRDSIAFYQRVALEMLRHVE